MQIRRRADNTLLSDFVGRGTFSGWKIDPKKKVLETVTGVTYIQVAGRRQWYCTATFEFHDEYPNSTVANMYLFLKLQDNAEWFRFTDIDGDTYDVRVRNTPEPDRDPDVTEPYFYLDVELLMAGYE